MIQASRGLREICSEDCFNPILDVLNVIIFGLKCKKKKNYLLWLERKVLDLVRNRCFKDKV